MKYDLTKTLLEADEQDEGNAFIGAASKAAVEDEEEFEVDGKKYPTEMSKEKAEEIQENVRSTIRMLISEICHGCEAEMLPIPTEEEEIEEEIIQPVLDMILAPAMPDALESQEGRMFDYGTTKSDSWEGKMTKGKLFRMAQMAQSLFDRMEDQDDLPEWLNNHVATAEDRLRSVYDYMDYELHQAELDNMDCTELVFDQ